jgi:hypothetical protein
VQNESGLLINQCVVLLRKSTINCGTKLVQIDYFLGPMAGKPSDFWSQIVIIVSWKPLGFCTDVFASVQPEKIHQCVS